MFDEYFKLPSAVSTPIFAATLLTLDTARSSSSTSIDKDAPSPTKEEPKNYKEAMIESSWIKAMQEEIYKFERLEGLEDWHRPEGYGPTMLLLCYSDPNLYYSKFRNMADVADNVVEEEWICFLGGNSSSGTNKYWGSNSSDGGNTGDGVKISGCEIGDSLA
ncbi:hypothetical protein Tco_0079027 [Tanacetum coccineum]